MKSPRDLPGERPAVVVTGASAGIGREIAKMAAAEGGPVVLVARSAEALAEAADEARRAGGEAFAMTLDVALPDAPAELERFLAAHRLTCGILVNNAGSGLLGPAASLAREDQLRLIDLNIRALTALTLWFLPQMLARRRGGIINLSSVAGFLPGPNMAVYYATKAFVRSFSEALSEELRGTGVTVTCVAPGPVATAFLAKAGARRVRMFKAMPKMTAERVARAAWRGFKRGRRLVVPGAMASVTVFAVTHLPHAFILPVVARLQRGRAGERESEATPANPCPLEGEGREGGPPARR
jgi:uncharacterized protein